MSTTDRTYSVNNVASDLLKLVLQELHFVEKSFEEAKRNMDQILTQISEARTKLDDLLVLRISRYSCKDRVLDQLQQLKKEVSHLKSKIPFNLVNSSLANQSAAAPNLNWRPRPSRHHRVQAPACDMVLMEHLNGNPNFHVHLHAKPPSTFHEVVASLDTLDIYSKELLRCYMVFPGNAVVKRTLIVNLWRAYEVPWLESVCFDEVMAQLVAKGFINHVYKKSTMSLASYWMHPYIRSCLNRSRYWFNESVYLAPSPIDEGDIIYSDSRQFTTVKSLRIMHLGKWHRSLSVSQHIEVTDPDLFFKGMENLTELRYISLRGVSVITELPQFISKLKRLQILDIKACHSLEVIPHNINNLWTTLTHLDMSECYFLDHMPATLSDLCHLRVLKGFFVGETTMQHSCTVRDLIKLSHLEKLNIYTSVRGFPDVDQIQDLQMLKNLRNLTISWGGCQTPKAGSTTTEKVLTHDDLNGLDLSFSFMLEKLDLQCVPETVTHVWLNPTMFKNLKRLYIRGGKFFDLGQGLDEQIADDTLITTEEDQWTVQILRLRYLSKLKMDWSEVKRMFPKLIRLEKVECPNLRWFPCDDNGLWINSTQQPPTASL